MSDPLTPDHAASLLLASMETLRREVEALPPEALDWHPGEGEWCLNEVVGHLIETEERGFRGRIGRILADPGRKLSDWDPPQVAKARRDCEKDGMELLRTLEQDRAQGVRMVGTLNIDSRRFRTFRPRELYLSRAYRIKGLLERAYTATNRGGIAAVGRDAATTSRAS